MSYLLSLIAANLSVDLAFKRDWNEFMFKLLGS